MQIVSNSKSPIKPRLDLLPKVAIDFGCHSSGWVFELPDMKGIKNLHQNRNWPGNVSSSYDGKCPTSILYDQNKNVLSFGFEAYENYFESKNSKNSNLLSSESRLIVPNHEYCLISRLKLKLVQACAFLFQKQKVNESRFLLLTCDFRFKL